MTKTSPCVGKDALIEYLYGDIDADARLRVEAHLRSCLRCADDLGGLKTVRGALDAWVPPEANPGVRLVADSLPEAAPVSVWGRYGRRSVWGFAAAAVLVLAAATIVARPEVRIGSDGVVIRLGGGGAAGPVATRSTGRAAPASQSDLATLGTVLRQEMEALRGTPAVAPAPQDLPRTGAEAPGRLAPLAIDDDGLRSVRELIHASEQRQELVFDARMRQVEEQIANQRRADLVEMQRAFAGLDVTGEELVRRRELLDYLMRISVP